MPAAVAVGVAPGLVFAVAVAVLVPLLHVVVASTDACFHHAARCGAKE